MVVVVVSVILQCALVKLKQNNRGNEGQANKQSRIGWVCSRQSKARPHTADAFSVRPSVYSNLHDASKSEIWILRKGVGKAVPGKMQHSRWALTGVLHRTRNWGGRLCQMPARFTRSESSYRTAKQKPPYKRGWGDSDWVEQAGRTRLGGWRRKG